MPVLPGCATVSEAMALCGARLQGAEILPGRGLRRDRVAEVGGGAAGRGEILPDRRNRRQERRVLSRLPERARGRRLVGRAEGRVSRPAISPASRSLRARPPRCAADMSVRRRRAFDWSAAVITVLAVTSAALVYRRDGQARFLAILTDDLGLFGMMLPKVLAGCLIGAFVTMLLPRETVARWVGADSGLGGILFATVAGAILPGGPFTIYPIAGALLAAGADAGAACAFVISWTPARLRARARMGASVLRPRLRDLAHHCSRCRCRSSPASRRARPGSSCSNATAGRREPDHRHRAVDDRAGARLRGRDPPPAAVRPVVASRREGFHHAAAAHRDRHDRLGLHRRTPAAAPDPVMARARHRRDRADPRDLRGRADAGRPGGRLRDRDRRAQERGRRATGDRLHDRLGAVRAPARAGVRDPLDAAEGGLAAGHRSRCRCRSSPPGWRCWWGSRSEGRRATALRRA